MRTTLLFEVPTNLLATLTSGRTELTAEERSLLGSWLSACLVSREQLRVHIRNLQAKIEPLQAKAAAWSPEKLDAILQHGLRVCSNSELVVLALDCLSLHELFDRIQETMPQVWQPLMAEHGARLRSKYGLQPSFPQTILVIARHNRALRLNSADVVGDSQVMAFDVEDRLSGTKDIRLPSSVALHCYGQAHKTVKFFLHTFPSSEPGMVIPQLEVYPVPDHSMTVTVPFLNSAPQEITIHGPASSIGEGKEIAESTLIDSAELWLGFPPPPQAETCP